MIPSDSSFSSNHASQQTGTPVHISRRGDVSVSSQSSPGRTDARYNRSPQRQHSPPRQTGAPFLFHQPSHGQAGAPVNPPNQIGAPVPPTHTSPGQVGGLHGGYATPTTSTVVTSSGGTIVLDQSDMDSLFGSSPEPPAKDWEKILRDQRVCTAWSALYSTLYLFFIIMADTSKDTAWFYALSRGVSFHTIFRCKEHKPH